ncbi:MAG: alpha/beta hydrolase [Acidimicrobiales bacterium]
MALPVLEALILGMIGAHGAQALAPQASAPAPFGVFHDLRWLLVFHPSWHAFALELASLIVVRSAITALLLRAAWPIGKEPPGALRLAIGSVAFTVVSALVLLPFAALLLGMAIVSLSWLFFIAVPSVLGVAALLHHGAVVPTWWRERPPGRTIAWILLSFLVLTTSSAVIMLTPAPLRLPAVGAAGLFNAWAWHSIVHTLSCARRARRFIPVAPLGVATLVGVIVLGVSVGFSVTSRSNQVARAAHGTTTAPGVGTGSAADATGRPVLLVSGFGSRYSGQDDGIGTWADGRRFSYRGIGPDGRPLPYEDAETYQDVSRSVAMMARQVDAFRADVERPVTIVAESEGAVIAKAYLMSHPDAPVDALVLLSPLVEPGGAYYPPAGDDGWGVAGGLGLRWITAVVRTLSPLDVSTDEGLFRSLADEAPALREMLACPVDGVDQLAVFPLADAVAGAEPHLDGVPSAVVPAFHGGLADNPAVQRTIRTVLEGGVSPEHRWWKATDRVIRAGAAAWRVPMLPISVNPAWEAGDDASSCGDIAHLVEARMN